MALGDFCSCHIDSNNVSLTCANTGSLWGNMTKNQITNIFKIDWVFFCLYWWWKFLTLYSNEPFWNQLSVSWVSLYKPKVYPVTFTSYLKPEHAAHASSLREQVAHGFCFQSHLYVLWMLWPGCSFLAPAWGWLLGLNDRQ